MFGDPDMKNIPAPIFQKKLSKISWKKIYAREYGVQYSEMAILCLSSKAKPHIPNPSFDQIIMPDGSNTAFYIDSDSWKKLVESLNKKYTTKIVNLSEYEKQFNKDGLKYLSFAKKISVLKFKKLSNKELKKLYTDYQEKLFRYSIFAWTSFILNNYISERAKSILDVYIKKYKKKSQAQDIYNSLFKPEKLAAVLQLQYEVSKYHGKLSMNILNKLYENYKWLSCLDLHNKPWTKKEFAEHIKTFKSSKSEEVIPFSSLIKEFKISNKDLDYLQMAKRFVYVKDARDDFRRQGVFYALPLFREIAKRMKIKSEDISYLQQSEIEAFLDGKYDISQKIIKERKKGFVLYLSNNNELICLQGDEIQGALSQFKLFFEERNDKFIQGTVAFKGKVSGKVAIVRGIKDLDKVKIGYILVAVTTHPDYVPAMRKSAAIVTDEGGITSHAAIIAREFGIPCIVGTQRATKILHDGDLVEVNAEEGTCRRFTLHG